uniref:Uncharacterized protein n=1 Tax=Panagrolaimus sp. PS1159 TaxID=55785 RepID=A0AC35FYE8_9BILA
MEGNLFKPNEIDADLRGRLEMLKKYANAEIHKCDELIIEQEKQLEGYKNLRKKVSDFPKLLRREDWLPINDYAFIRGTYDNTNKFYTLLGSQYFAERSSVQTVEFIDRRIKGFNDIKEGYEKQKELAKSRLEFAENLFNQEKSDIVEIREPYDDEKMKVKKEPKENVSNKDFEAIMSRLNELENEENEKVESIERANEIKVENTVEVKKEDESEDSKVVAPKGVSQEEFENLIKRVDQMIESSDDEEGYEDEDMSEDENALDSDDSLPEVVNKIIKEEPKQVKLESPSKVPPLKKYGVRFSSELEAGPTVTSTEKSSIYPKPILRNKDVKTPVDEEAVKKMNEVVPERKILPATDAFKGVFLERNLRTLEPSTSAAATSTAEMKKPVSKFKAKRMNL